MKIEDLTIKKKKDKEKKNEPEYIVLHPFFPNVSRVLISGPGGCGKTVLLVNILLKPLIYFTEIIMYTKTEQQEKVQELLKIFNKIAKDAKIPPFFTIKSGAVDDVETLPKRFRVVIFDDYICEKKEVNAITKYYVLGRHYGCSPVYLGQSYYSVHKNIRVNTSNFCLFNVGTKREVRSILQDHNGLTEEQYHRNTKGHDFICINKITKWIGKNLDEPLE